MAQENVGACVGDAIAFDGCPLTGVVESQDASGRWSDEPSISACDSCKRGCECTGGKGGQVEIVQVAVYAVEQFVCAGNVWSVLLVLLRVTVEQLNSKVRWVHSGYAWLHVGQRKEIRPIPLTTKSVNDSKAR